MHIQYFIESNIPKEMNNSNYYINDELKAYEAPRNNIMSFIPNYQPECFSEIMFKKCPVEFIDFYHSDLRMGLDFSNIDVTLSQKLQSQKENKISELFVLNKPHKTKFTAKHSKVRKERIYKYSTDDYESILYNTISSSLSIDRSITTQNIPRINGTSILKILKLLINDPLKCAKIIFDPSNPMIINSYLLKSMMLFSNTCKNPHECAKFCLQLFYDYFVFIVKSDNDINFKDIKKAIKEYDIDTEILHQILLLEQLKESSKISDKGLNKYASTKYLGETRYELSSDDIKMKRKIISYGYMCDNIAKTIMMAFNDMYTLFSSWVKLSPLAIYNAGDSHCRYLSKFLESYYDIKEFTKHSDDTLKWDLPYSHNNISRCLDLNIDDEIFHNFINQYDFILTDKQLKYLDEFKKKYDITTTRIKMLGKLYNKMLAGEMLSKDELEKKCDNVEECIKKCGLLSINLTIQEEYIFKV